MIELELTQSIVNKHYGWVFKTNKDDEGRLYQKLKSISENESQEDKKNIYEYIFNKLSTIIKGNLEELQHLIDDYEKLMVLFRVNDTKEIKKVRGRDKHIGAKEREVLATLSDIFLKEYKYFYSSKYWNAYIFLQELDVSICPYCCSQFIFLYNTDKKTRATLDHFFDKATYPFLAISIYNLVPACKVCNSDFKSTKEFNLEENYSPYERRIVEKIEFKIDVTTVKKSSKIQNDNSEIDYYGMFIGDNTDFQIKLDIDKSDEQIYRKIQGNLDTFKIVELYNKYHKHYVKSLIRKSHIYNKVYIQTLSKTFDLMFINEADLIRSIYLPAIDDKNNMLGKLGRDIAKKQLEFLNS